MKTNSTHNKSTGGLSRSDIDRYKSLSEAEKHLVESHALEDDFENDALEGWTDSDLNTGVLKQLDSRFIKKPFGLTAGMIVLTIIGIASVFTWLFWPVSTLEEPEKLAQITPTNIERTDLTIPAYVDTMTEAPVSEQIQPTTIISNRKKQEATNKSTETTVKVEAITVDKLPLIRADIPKRQTQVAKKSAKETYMYDFKLLDYRNIRSPETVQVEKLVLTGLPANQESDSAQVEEFTWQKSDIPYHEYLRKTMEFFSLGSYKNALTRFQVVIATYPQDVNAHFYGGLCYYNLKQYDAAIEEFHACLSNEYTNFNEESEWLLAESYRMAGQKSKAKMLYQMIIDNQGYYMQQATTELKRLR